MRVICIGDSLTFGYGVPSSVRWTTLVSRQTDIPIENMGINGDTAIGMLARIEQLQSAKQLKGSIIVVTGGSNDIFYSGSTETARSAIGAIVHQIVAAGGIPVLGIPLPVYPQLTPKEWAKVVDFERSATQLKQYTAWLKKFCIAFDVQMIDFSADFLNGIGEPIPQLFLDGLHPTPVGHQLMAKRFLAGIMPILRWANASSQD